MAKKNNMWLWVIAIIVIGFLVYKYNPGMFSTVETSNPINDNYKTMYESKTCSLVLASIKDPAWSFSCDAMKEDCSIHFMEAKLSWEDENKCINAMDDEDNKCRILYTDGTC